MHSAFVSAELTPGRISSIPNIVKIRIDFMVPPLECVLVEQALDADISRIFPVLFDLRVAPEFFLHHRKLISKPDRLSRVLHGDLIALLAY